MATRLLRRLLPLLASFVLCFAPSAGNGEEAEPDTFCSTFSYAARRIAVGSDGTIVVAGYTLVADLPATAVVPEPLHRFDYDGGFLFVTALEPDGRPKWTTYLPAWPSSSRVRGLAVHSDGSIWIGAARHVTPVHAPFSRTDADGSDAVVAKLSAAGDVVFAANFGGDESWVNDLVLTPDGDAVVVGTTSGSDIPGGSTTPGSRPFDAFVARIRADGSEIAWSRRFGAEDPIGHAHVDGCGVALDPSASSVIVSLVGKPHAARMPEAVRVGPYRRHSVGSAFRPDTYLLRLDLDGATLAAARLDFLVPERATPGTSYGRPLAPVAIDREGSVLVAGQRATARISPDLRRLEAVRWHARVLPLRAPRCIRTRPDGRIFVLHVLDSEFGGANARVEILGPDLAVSGRAPGLGFTPNHAVIDAGGLLHALGPGWGASFNDRVGTTGFTRTCVAKVRLDDRGPPRSFCARRTATGDVVLSWRAGPDRPDHYEIEAGSNLSEVPPVAIAIVSAETRSYRVTGLDPDAPHEFRLVAVFPSGERAVAESVRD